MLKIYTDKAPKPIGPYSQAVLAGGLIFISGQLGIDPQTGELNHGIEEQTRQALINISHILAQAGSSLSGIVNVSAYITNMDEYQLFNNIYTEFFMDHAPSRSVVGVSALPRNALVEIEAVALVS
jgi:2-iminobutanoate/2-iminopropanoate deaminase